MLLVCARHQSSCANTPGCTWCKTTKECTSNTYDCSFSQRVYDPTECPPDASAMYIMIPVYATLQLHLFFGLFVRVAIQTSNIQLGEWMIDRLFQHF
jgi:hypothetical protein